MPAAAKVPLAFDDIVARLAALDLPAVDLVVGIASGGTVPAGLVAYRLGVPLTLLTINYRDRDNRPQRPSPELLTDTPLPTGRRVLLVDDVSVSGATLDLAKGLLAGNEVTTLVMKGRGDRVAFPEVGSCVVWPWSPLASPAARD
jgi:hypoxanthine phosphoribosyltransferase